MDIRYVPLGKGDVVVRVAKVTISVPADVLSTADRLARQEGTSRSGIITRLIQQEEQRRREELMARGYKELGKEDCQEVEESLPAQAEVVLRDD